MSEDYDDCVDDNVFTRPRSRDTNPAGYYFFKGVLSRSEAEDAAEFIHRHKSEYIANNPEYYDPPLFVKRRLTDDLIFYRDESILFIDWCFLHNYQNNEKIAKFVTVVARKTSGGPARRFAQNARGFTRLARKYYADALAALVVDVAYGATDRIVIRLEDIVDDKKTVDVAHWTTEDYRATHGLVRRIEKRPTMLVNGQYRCYHRAAVILNLPNIVGGFVTLRPADESAVWDGPTYGEEFADVWLMSCRTTGKGESKQFLKGESYFRQCRGIAIANFVGMEIGRLTKAVDELAMESRKSRKDRKTEKNKMELKEWLWTAEESGQFSPFEISLLNVLYDPANFGCCKPDLQDILNLSMNERTFDRHIKSVKTRFSEFCRRIMED